MTRAKDISKILTDADLSGTLDVTGTITVGDGHTIGDDGADNLHLESSTGEGIVLRSPEYVSLISGGTPSALVANNGDISFYEDTGTTPKLFWDSSAESLTIGTATITPNGAADDLVIAKSGSTGLNFISGTSDAQTIAFGDTSDSLVGSLQYFHSDDHMEFTVNNAERMRITSSGNVGINDDAPNRMLQLKATGTGATQKATIMFENEVGTTGSIGQGDTNSNAMIFTENGSERMRITSIGNVGIGTTSPDNVGSTTALTINHTNGNGQLSLMANGTVYGRIFADNNNGDLKMGNPTSNDVMFYTANLERLRIGSSGNVGIGTASPSGAAGTTLAINGGSGQSRLALKNTNTGDASGDGFQLSVGTDGSVGIEQRENNYMALYTNATERMRISSDGRIGMGNSNPNSARLHINQNAVNEQGINLSLDSGSYTNIGMLIQAAKGQASDFFFHQCKSNNGADTEFSLRGDGQAYADGSWNGGGADYAEYFEWADGNTDSEDRRGYTVVLENNKIRKATSDDDASIIVGVISGNPSMVGDSDIGQWKHKYQRDDYGTYIRDESGNRVLNTDYDGSQEYVSRENRQEWDTVGLMGKLRIRKNQPTGSNWIKMRDISETVEEWLVR